MLIKYISIIFSFFFLSCATLNAQIYKSDGVTQVELNDILSEVTAGTVLVVGEMHGKSQVRDQHLGILSALRAQGARVSVGMEFFNYTDQIDVQNYRLGQLTEDDFKKQIKWSGFDFSLYKSQLLFPDARLGEYGLGLNMPRSITQIISKQGLSGLTPEQAQLMPPDFTVGRDLYRKRFYDLMSDGHIPFDKLENYFIAQSTWDDTMAWQTVHFMKHHPDHVFVIFVGEFHVQYGGGLPHRIQERLVKENLNHKIKIKTISQIWTENLTQEELRGELIPSEEYGSRADFIFLVNP